MGQTWIERMVGKWIGNEASYIEAELPEEIGVLDYARVVTSRVLRAAGAGADRLAFEAVTDPFKSFECLNAVAQIGVLGEPDDNMGLYDMWDQFAGIHEDHKIVPDTDPWLEVKADERRAKVGVRFSAENKVSDLAEVVCGGVYHLTMSGARLILVELERDTCVLMTPNPVTQETVDKSFDEILEPDNKPLLQVLRDTAKAGE